MGDEKERVSMRYIGTQPQNGRVLQELTADYMCRRMNMQFCETAIGTRYCYKSYTLVLMSIAGKLLFHEAKFRLKKAQGSCRKPTAIDSAVFSAGNIASVQECGRKLVNLHL